MKAYKGFDKNLRCDPTGKNPFQYEIGKNYEEPEADLCNLGFHACENPLDVFSYYSPSDSRYCEVELDEVSDKKDNDSKVCGKKIKIGAEIGLKGIIEAGVKFIFDKVDWKNSAATNTGDRSAATNTGDWSAATNTGDWSAATNTGDRSAATNTGDRSAATNTGARSAATNTGDRSAATNTGDRSAATNTGDWSAATNTGYQSAAVVLGKESIAIATGYESKAKGKKGCWLVLTEWEKTAEHIKCVKSYKVDGRRIKADTFYTLKDGKAVECE